MLEAIFYTLSITFLFRLFYYAIGEPDSSQNPQAILSSYVLFLSENRLHKSGIEVTQSVDEQLDTISQAEQKQDLYRSTLNYAMPLFTYEFILGICPICTFFWVSILLILIPTLLVGTSFLTALFLMSSANILNKILIKWI